MPEYKINVSVNPNEQPPQTSSEYGLTSPTASETPNDKFQTVKNFAVLGIAAQSAKQVGSVVVGNVGRITGNQRLQRNIDQTLKVVGYGTQLAVGFSAGGVGGVVAAVGVAVQLGAEQFNRNLDQQEANIQSNYERNLNGYRVKGNR